MLKEKNYVSSSSVTSSLRAPLTQEEEGTPAKAANSRNPSRRLYTIVPHQYIDINFKWRKKKKKRGKLTPRWGDEPLLLTALSGERVELLEILGVQCLGSLDRALEVR
jgi:hypothetical protein